MYELTESKGRLDESMKKCMLLVESIHALDEQRLQCPDFRVMLLEMDQKNYPKLFWCFKTCFSWCNVYANPFTMAIIKKLQVLYKFVMILEILDNHVLELMNLDDHRNYL